MTQTRSEKKQATREKILGAAYALFTEKGYDETSYGEIAERAGVGYGTIYSHFSSKENLLLEHYLELILLQAAQLKAMAAMDKGINPLQTGLDMIDTVWNQNLTDKIRKLTIFFSYRWVSSKQDYDRVLHALNAVLRFIGTSFEQAQENGFLKKTINIPVVLSIIRATYLHALQNARFGEEERILAKQVLDEQINYLLQIERPISKVCP